MRLLAAAVLMTFISAQATQRPDMTLTVYVTDRWGRGDFTEAQVQATNSSSHEEVQLAHIGKGEYRARVDYGDYVLETRYAGFIRNFRQISVTTRNTWVAVGMRVSQIEGPEPTTALRGRVSLSPQEPKPRWIKLVSVFGSETREALINDDGTYRLEDLDGQGPYTLWVVAAERLCGMRNTNFERAREVTLNWEFKQPCALQK